MGAIGSKLGQHVPEADVTQGSLPSTPILAPKTIKSNMDLDPRSPSANISRTPIAELLDAAVSVQQIALDPRSPTVDFNRTPIIVPSNEEEDLLKTLHKKNLLRQGPKLLESSPITSKVVKRRSFIGVLETNLDFTETDLDLVQRLKINATTPKRVEILRCENADPRSPTVDFLRTPVQVCKKIGEIDLNQSKEEEDKVEATDEETKEAVEGSNSAKDIVSEEAVEGSNSAKEIVLEEEAVEGSNSANEIVSKEEAVVSIEHLVCAVSVVNQITKEVAEKAPPVDESLSANVTTSVNDFDKKLTDLIYEDSNMIVIPRIVKLRDNNRTPLGVRNSTGNVARLKVSDKPRKSDGRKSGDYAGSKIPVFKVDKGLKKATRCENTPPSNAMKKKMNAKRSHWDEEASLII